MDESRNGIAIDVNTAARMIREQFPEWAGCDIRPLDAKGTDNLIVCIGNDLCARFPKVPWATGTARREAMALPRFAGSPIAVPQVYALGKPDADYPFEWSVLGWLPGEPMEEGALIDADASARQLAAFFNFVRGVSPDAAFAFGSENNGRGAPLASRSAPFEAALAQLPSLDLAWATRLWSDALRAAPSSAPVWLHGDVHPGNVLMEDGRISGVIDWGLCGVGDGACDLLSAWAMFDRGPRETFRKSIGASDTDWLRGAGWALSMAMIYLPYAYANGLRSDMSERMLARLKEDFA